MNQIKWKSESEKPDRVKVSICILTYNRCHILKELLESLVKLTYSPIEIVVVDNASDDGTETMLRSDFCEMKYIRLDRNVGVGARNVAIKRSTGDILISLDDDVMGINDESLRKLVRKFESMPELGAICFRITDYVTGKICNWCHHYKKEEYCDKEFVTDEITEGAVAFRKTVFQKTGLYPERFFISYEGPDLLIRMLEAGFITIYSPEIRVRHRNATEGRNRWRRYYYDTRNQIWFVVRNYPFWLGAKYLARGLTAMLVYSLRDGYAIYWAKGIWDGIKELPLVQKERRPFSDHTTKVLSEIASHRPSIWYQMKQRLFKKEVRL